MVAKNSNYMPRLIDQKIERYLNVFGAIAIEGPKWCGKTWTSRAHSQSEFYLSSSTHDSNTLSLVKIDPYFALRGDSPHLIDEWQLYPPLWDIIRNDVDERQKKGLYILTGSSTPNREGIFHSGAGRFAKLKMSPMSLYESKDSSGKVSLMDLFDGKFENALTGKVELENIINLIIRGGWPANLSVDPKDSSLLPREYIRLIVSDEINRVSGKKYDLNKIGLLLKSLARNESTTCSFAKLRSDIIENGGNIDVETIPEYLNILSDLYLIENQEAFSVNLRSSIRLKQQVKRHFVDPSIAAALINATEQKLLNDLQTLGFLFEALVERDLRIYAEAHDATLYHYQDYKDNEIDAIVSLDDGRFCAIEIKLGVSQIDEAAANLLKIKSLFGKEPSFLCVICAMSNASYLRPDGVYVVPITALKD